MTRPTFRDLHKEGAEGLSKTAYADPESVARYLLSHASGRSMAELFLREDEPVPEPIESVFRKNLARVIAGEPLWYVVGTETFYGLSIHADERVLVPRPETEFLVEWILETAPKDRSLRAADIGTGSGSIALALARHLPRAEVYASDISADALEVARENARRNQLETRIQFRQGDLFEPFRGMSFDHVVMNPPYVAHEDLGRSMDGLHYEPRVALDGGKGGLEVIARFLNELPNHLAPGGMAFLEIGAEQGRAVTALARQAGFTDVKLRTDYAGHDRYVRLAY